MSDELQQQIGKLRAARDAGILDEATFRAAVAGLEATYQATIGDGSAAAQGPGSKAAVGGSLINPGIIEGNVYIGAPTDDPAVALRIYREVLVATSERLPLRTIDVRASDPRAAGRLRLTNVYIDLNTTTRERPDERVRDKEPPPISALQAVIRNRKLVLTGDRGGGKSTFVNHLTHCLAAHALWPDKGWLNHLAGWPAGEARLLPLPVILRDFAADGQVDRTQPPVAATLWGFIERRLAAQNLAFVMRPLMRALDRGEVLVLLDGLDEVAGRDQRRFVRDAVSAFVARYRRNRFLVTCLILAYQPPASRDEPDLRLDMADFPVYELAPFNEEQIDRFIDAWYAELVRLGEVSAADAATLGPGLRQAVRRPDLWWLAPNPLLLSVMALLHAHQSGHLPDARAALYEQAVEMLLWRWEEKKLGGAAPPTLRELLTAANRADLDLKRVLWQLAHAAHAATDPAAGDEALGNLGERQLTHALERLKPGDWTWVHALVEAIKLRAGLLLEREPGVFTFPHRTFQEYLAGVYLANLNDFSQQAYELAAQGSHWREALLLAAGHLTQQGQIERALLLPQRLLPQQPLTPGAGGTAWRRVWLAGDAIAEIGIQRVAEDAIGADVLSMACNRLVALVEGGHLTARERAAAGDTLAALGDERPGVGVRVVNGQTLPDLLFDYVPPGAFWMGSPDDDPEADSDEQSLHQVDVPYGYWMARYPLTIAQWRAFVAASGHTPRDRDSLDGAANRPAIWLSWYDGMALCRWLSAAGQRAGWLPDGWYFNLPSEAEWEKAARGGVQLPATATTWRLGQAWIRPHPARIANPLPQRRYAWGAAPLDVERANYDATGIGRPTAVGAFAAGNGPYGSCDLVGNIWEWTRSLKKQYPYNKEDGREASSTFNNSSWISIRGGAYYSEKRAVRCAYRYDDNPYYGDDSLGVRVVLSPFPPLISDASDL